MALPHPIKRYSVTITKIVDLGRELKEFHIAMPDDFTFTAGQFITIFFERDAEKYRRQYSISSEPSLKGTVIITVKKVDGGPGTSYLWERVEGDALEIMAPLGVFIVKEPHKETPLTFIGTGTGIAPYKSIIVDLLESGYDKELNLLAGHRYEALYYDFFTGLEKKYLNFHYYTAITKTDDEKYTVRGRVQELIDKVNTSGHIYICGLQVMIQQIQQLLAVKMVPISQIHQERYD